MQYTSPKIVSCGDSQHLIKGECGWGTENATFDKTGAYKTTKRRMELVQMFPQEVRVCKVVEACSSDSNEC
ncbi:MULTISPECIES: hypothetical protein [Paenibacillus]|jgi:hypothetical protein|uniref:hypothetical protein n=1 Tax=Paenibacillus TaxID=44249 RepID=UPI00049769D1|nr:MULTISPECIES: hypothetical protein [Paenibacillus]MCF2716485.1 hypothetical protein [Paenibacillus sp. UKAQ_18]UMY54738.1 hypothetical protein MLD56_24955 [Paenibacillus peoriae]